MNTLYRATCEKAWDGDQWGNEWRQSFVVLKDDEGSTFAVYSDDAVCITRRGQAVPAATVEELATLEARNGGFVAQFPDFTAACRAADACAVHADACAG